MGLIVNPETDEIFTGERFTGNVYTVDAGTGAMDLLGMPTGAFVSDLALPCLAFPVPEPGTLTVLALGLVGLVLSDGGASPEATHPHQLSRKAGDIDGGGAGRRASVFHFASNSRLSQAASHRTPGRHSPVTALPIRLLAVSAAERHDRFKMKLDRGDRQRFMFNRHDHTVRRSHRHPQTGR